MVVIVFLAELSITSNGVIIVGFYNRVSDPLLGGSYLTALISFSNLGATLTSWSSLRLVKLFDYQVFYCLAICINFFRNYKVSDLVYFT